MPNTQPKRSGTVVAAAEEQAAIRAQIEAIGEVRLAEACAVSRDAVLRAASGGRVRRSTLAAIRAGLSMAADSGTVGAKEPR